MQTAADVKTPEFYAANPGALADLSEDQIDALANQPKDVDTEPAGPKGETTSSESPAAASQTTEAQPEAAPAAAGAETKGIQAKDGQNIIPYSVLERERDRAARAEQTAQALAAQVEQLRAGKTPGDASAVALSDEDLAQLDQDLPGVAKAIRAQMALIGNLTGTVQTLQRENDVQAQNREQAVQDEVGVALAGNPDLAAWQEAANRKDNPDPLMWNRAVDLDSVLRADPAWMDKPVSERFAKVAETIKSLYGVPAAQPAAPAALPNAQALQAKADAALAAAAKTGTLPRSSSDIPGGSAPPVDEAAAMMDRSGAELTADFMSMTPEQIEARLSRLR